MATPKIYSLIPGLKPYDSKNHKVVKAAHKRGLTGIKVYHYSSKDAFALQGWYLECDQLAKTKFIGFEAKSAVDRIALIQAEQTAI